MVSRGDIEAGGAVMFVRLDDSGFKEGAKKIYKDLEKSGKAVVAAGKSMGAALDIPMRKSVIFARRVAGAYDKLGYKMIGIGNTLAMTGWHFQHLGKTIFNWKNRVGPVITRVGGIIHNFGVRMVGITGLVRNQFRHIGNVVGLWATRIGTAFRYMREHFVVLGARMTSVARQLAVAVILMSAVLIAGVKTYATFSKEMAFVSTMVDDTKKHMGDFTKGIRELSVEFGESTANLSRGLYDILSAGLSAEKALDVLTITTMAAKAGMADAAESTKAIIAVLNSYSLGAEHAEYVADRLFATVRYGVTTFAELSSHIGLVAASAAQMGVTINELGTALAVITRGGIETSAAVIALQNVLKAFSTPTGAGAEFAKRLKEAGLGIDMTIKGLKKYGFINLMKKIGKLPTEHIVRLFPQIRGQRGAMAIKAGMANIDAILLAHKRAGGLMREAYAKVEKSFGMLVDRAKQAGALVLSYLGEVIAGGLAKVAVNVGDIALGFGVWAKANKELIISTGKFVVELGKLAIALWAVGKAIAFIGIMSRAVMAATAKGGLAGLLKGMLKGVVAVGAGVAIWKLVEKSIGKAALGLEEIGKLGKEKRIKESFTEAGRVLEGLKKSLEGNAKMISDAEKMVKFRGGVYGYPAWREAEKGLVIFKKVEERLKRQIKEQKKLVKEEEKALEITKEKLIAEKAMSAMSRYRMGHFAGYWHTPVLAYATVSKETQQLDVMKGIRENTVGLAEGGVLSDAIIRMGEAK